MVNTLKDNKIVNYKQTSWIVLNFSANKQVST